MRSSWSKTSFLAKENFDATKKVPLILGRPFLSTAKAHIDVGAEEIQFTINGAQEKFNFKPKVE